VTRLRLAALALLTGASLLLGISWAAAAHPYRHDTLSGTGGPVNSQITANFRTFRRPRTQADALPLGLESFGTCGGEGRHHYTFCAVGLPGLPQPTSAANDWKLSFWGKTHTLQVRDSRRIALPDGLGAIFLIPSGRWLCAAFNPMRRWHKYYVRMTCATIGLILREPPVSFAGYFFGSPPNVIMMAVEPDEIASATIDYPGGTEQAYLHDGALVACVGQGPYELEQRTAQSKFLPPIRVGAYGAFKPADCPRLHFSNG
jgi:hypothetical protein